jgi:RNA polymerase sigma factor (sigma-70 family)
MLFAGQRWMMALTMTGSVARAETAPAADPLRTLFDAARGGDERSLGELCGLVRPRLYRAAYAILRDGDEADDIAQEALVRAVTRKFLFLGRGSVGGWMTRIAINLAKNKLRDKRRRHEILETSSGDDRAARGAQPNALESADTVAASNQIRERLILALEKLPERQRDVVRLHVIGQMDFVEIGAALGISDANARVTFSQAKKKLMAHLGESHD